MDLGNRLRSVRLTPLLGLLCLETAVGLVWKESTGQ